MELTNKSKTLKGVLIGATGATGKIVLNTILTSRHWSHLTVISRRKLDNTKLPLSDCIFTEKIVTDLDVLNKSKEDLIEKESLDLTGYDVVFNCLGSQVKHGETTFRKVDHDYVIYSASLCEKFSIPHFTHITAEGSNPKSMFLYMRVKGEVENKLMTMNIKRVTILKPGLIKSRENQRCGECIAQTLFYICCCCLCLSAIDCRHLSISMVLNAEDESRSGYITLTNKEIQNIYDNSRREKVN